MSSNLRTLPIWKRNASAAERLSELALLAQEHPERFERFVIVYREDMPERQFKIRTLTHDTHTDNLTYESALGLLEAGKFRINEDTKT